MTLVIYDVIYIFDQPLLVELKRSMRHPSSHSRVFRNQWLALAIVLLTLSGFVSYFLFDSYQKEMLREQTHLQNLSRVAADVVERRLTTTDAVLQMVIDTYPEWSRRQSWEYAGREIERLAKIAHGTDILAVLDTTGTMVAVNLPDLHGKNFAYRYYFEKAKNSENVDTRIISPPFKTVLGDYTFTISRKIVGADGSFVGVAMATIDTPFLGKLLAESLYAPDMYAQLSHGDGIEILMTPERVGQGGEPSATPGSFVSKHQDNGGKESLQSGVESAAGRDLVVAIRTIRPDSLKANSGLILTLGRQRAAILSPWKKQAATIGTLLFFAIGGGIFGLAWYQRRTRGIVEQLFRKKSQVDSATDALFVLDATGRVLDANPAFLALVGYAQSDFGSLAINHFCGAWPQEDISIALQNLLHNQTGLIRETSFRHVDGHQIAIELSLWGIEENSAGFIFASARNITERKAILAELARRESELRTIIESEPECVKLMDTMGRLIMINPAGLSILGVESSSQVLGKSMVDFVAPADRESFSAFGQSVMAGQSGMLEFDIVGINGTRHRMESHAVPIRDESGQVTSILAVTRDVTERHQAQDELRKLRLAIEQSPEGICITDMSGDIEYVNPAFIESCGYSRDELIGQNPRILSAGQTPLAVYAEMWNILRMGETWRGELINRRKNGEIYIESEIISPVRNINGQITHYLGVKQDVTEKKKTEDLLELHRSKLEELVAQRTEELQLANADLEIARDQARDAAKAKASFLSNMSHEIRTPMNGIIGMLHLLHRTTPNSKQLDYLRKMERSASHLLTLINDILDLSKIDAGKLLLESRPINIGQIVSAVASIVGESAQEKGLRLITDIGEKPSNLSGDTTRITQVLLNYASNAVKFTDHGYVKISVDRVSDTEKSATIRFTVEDSGPGIEQNAQARIFDAFEQADHTTTKSLKGTGLGLAIARNLAVLMGGETGLESTLGKGSTFWFTVSLQKAEENVDTADFQEMSDFEQKIQNSFSGANILLVEDEPINQEISVLLLEEAGLHVTVASNGLEALQAVRNNTFALILMDMQMPVMNGLEATIKIREMPDGKNIPVIAMTANAFLEDRERCLDAGMDAFLSKPVDPAALFKMVYRWLQGKV